MQRKYLSGSPEDLNNFDIQMQAIHRRKGVVVIGSVGRAALYATHGADVPPLPVRIVPVSTEDASLRDIDVLKVRDHWVDGDNGRGPHPVDHGLNVFFKRDKPVPTLTNGVALDPLLFKRRHRSLDGIPVYTYSVGTQLALEHFFVSRLREDASKDRQLDKYQLSLQKFEAFAEEVRHYRPTEFLSDEAYAPLLEPEPGA